LRNWYDRRVTPGIHNIHFTAKDAASLAAKMRGLGVRSMGEIVMGPMILYMYDATQQCGLRFEFKEE
jgi:hypothetical protein